ncbi:MAG: TetR/AcrR family transcriptional regulator [Caulobacter sp.]|nr:TetR/AcrR family transcriptional regulator [Caulobacter sp.]
MTASPPIDDPSGAPMDGRRMRSETSRLRIVEAMITLLSEMEGMPPAETVAMRAGVGLRTVFRLFEDMDGLYRGIQAAMIGRLSPLMEAPVQADSVREAIGILVDRRAEAFDLILPLQIAADSQRHRSPALQEGRLRLVQMQRAMMLAALPEAVRADPVLVDALDLTLSFEAWRRLRKDQGADVERAKAVMRLMALTLLGETP